MCQWLQRSRTLTFYDGQRHIVGFFDCFVYNVLNLTSFVFSLTLFYDCFVHFVHIHTSMLQKSLDLNCVAPHDPGGRL